MINQMFTNLLNQKPYQKYSVADPDPDPYVLGLSDPEPVIICTDPHPDPILPSTSKKVRKALISSIFLFLFDFFSLKTDVFVP